jgi:ABC-type amino acid transport system permease subunit
VGTMLAAGAQWTYVFVVPHISDAVPDLVNVGSGVLLVGFLVSYAVLSAGWVLFGIATLRVGIFRRWMGVLLLAGAVIAFLPMPSRTLLLAVGVAALGFQLIRETTSEADSAVAGQAAA